MTTIKDLKKQLEKTIRDAFVIKNGEIILRDDLTIGDVMDLKLVESLINNILVVAQTCAFADTFNDTSIKDGIKGNISNPNAKGFDVTYPKMGEVRVFAELKATVPCENNGTQYGSNQKKSIYKDLENLLGLSDKGKKENITPNDEKYMVLIDIKGQQQAFNNLKKPSTYNQSNIRVICVDPNTEIAQYDRYGWEEGDVCVWQHFTD